MEDRGPTDRVMTLTSDLDLQSQESYGHDLHTCKRSRLQVTWFKSKSGTDGQTDGRTEASELYLPCCKVRLDPPLKFALYIEAY